MQLETIPIPVPGQKQGPAQLIVYRINNISVARQKKRPFVLICGGGGYQMISDREREPILLKFLSMGCDGAILKYSVAPDVFPTALLELAKAVALVREKAESGEWNVDPEAIVTCGFSAGAHLAASLGVFWSQELVYSQIKKRAEEIRPDGQILCYPVITAGEKAHKGSMEKLTGMTYEALLEKPELIHRLSLEEQVNGKEPVTFLWHTVTDPSVPVENTLMFATALQKHGVNFELHIFPKGGHGLSLANEETAGVQELLYEPYCSTWIPMVQAWMEEKFHCLSRAR